MNFLRKNWGNLLLIAFIALLIIPQTGLPIKVFFNRLIAFSPSEIQAEKRETVSSYQWNLAGLDGTRVDFSRSEGKVIIVNFWATWCPPCVAEMPSFQKLFDTYGDQVDFYFVSLEDKEVLEKFLRKKGYDLPVYQQLSKAPETLRSLSLPTTYVIAKNGSIVMDKSGAADWNSDKVHEVLEKLLNER